MHNNLTPEVTDEIFQRHHLSPDEVLHDEWYPTTIVDDLYREILQQPNGPQALVAMGKAGVHMYIERLELTSVEESFHKLSNISNLTVRDVPEGYGYQSEKLGERHYRIRNNTATPNDLLYGAIWELMRVLTPEDQSFTVVPISGYPSSIDGVGVGNHIVVG